MLKRILVLALLLPTAAVGQSFVGSYRAVFIDLFSVKKMIVVEFSVSPERLLSGVLRIDGSERNFSGKVQENGRFEAVIEQDVNFTYKLKGKFDGSQKVSLIEREQNGSGLNKSVSERAIEGTFTKANVPLASSMPPVVTGPGAGLSDIGRSVLQVAHFQTLYGTTWTDIVAAAKFENSKRPSTGSGPVKDNAAAESPDLLVVTARTSVEGQQGLMISIPAYTGGRTVWKQNELRAASYRELKGEQRNTFLSGATLGSDPRYADGMVEIVRENATQIVLKLTNFKIKKLNKEEFVTLDGFIYAGK